MPLFKTIAIRVIVYSGIGFLILVFAGLALTSMDDNQGVNLPPARMDSQTRKHLDAGDWNAALDALIFVYEDENSDPNLRYYIALCYKKLGVAALDEKAYAEAVELFDAATEYRDDDVNLYQVLGYGHFNQSDYTAAASAFQAALTLDPDNVVGLTYMGQIHYLRDETKEAAAAWARALELSPNDQSLRDRLNKVKKQIRASGTLETDANHLFSVHYDGEHLPHMQDTVLEILEDAYYEIGPKLGAYPKRTVSVTLLTRETYRDITGSPEWTAGIYEGQIKIPVANANPANLRISLFHEYVHAVIYDMMKGRCPWWLNEGLAQYYSESEKQRTHKIARVCRTLSGDSRIPLADLRKLLTRNRESVTQAYALALSALEYLVDTYGDVTLRTILTEIADGLTVTEALESVINISQVQFEEDWRRAMIHSCQ